MSGKVTFKGSPLTLVGRVLKEGLATHAAGGLTENDFIMARIIDELEA